jgi:hypothetical protein
MLQDANNIISIQKGTCNSSLMFENDSWTERFLSLCGQTKCPEQVNIRVSSWVHLGVAQYYMIAGESSSFPTNFLYLIRHEAATRRRFYALLGIKISISMRNEEEQVDIQSLRCKLF